ncbi:hypothetical protein B0H15DRAFT_808867 [Mycena belliarum]|uniref:F-box domain-containing protein n=1 Tax=Mycena belliarum TaxID=1033014 RepID=A0AAD6ULP6_9AGAR|nr:hypothetical protein B0H15DRAFT_808867 [Mycena belliae]
MALRQSQGSAFSLLNLPEDVLLSILLLLRAEDILIVSQTCRVLHDFTSNSPNSADYLWHQLVSTSDLPPLDISEPYVDLPGPALQAIVTRALRIDHNWQRKSPRIKKLTRLVAVDHVCQMQFIGSHWLVVLRRTPAAASLAVWRIGDTRQPPYCAASLDIPSHAVPLKFSATMQKGSRKVLVAFISSTSSGTLLSAYIMFLKSQLDDDFGLPSPHAICSIHRSETEGRFYEIRAIGHIIAAGIPQFVNYVHSPSAYRILFLNTLTGEQCLVDPELPDHLAQLHFKLYPRHLVLTGVRNQSALVVRTHDLPDAMLNNGPPRPETSSTTLVSLTPPNAEYETPTSDLDYELSVDSTHNISHISAISFHSLLRKADDYIFHFPLDYIDKGRDGEPAFIYPFSTHTSASAEIICLGETGRRAVWLERRWTSDEYTLMKATFSPKGKQPAVVEPLLARNLALPFELHMCQCLAFDECTGRVCLALHTGELCILEF